MLAAAIFLDLLACRSAGVPRVLPVAARASLAFAEGREALSADDLGAARAAFLEAARLAPDWVSPARALDDLDRDALLGPAALARRLAELRANESAEALYLVGRLEGPAGFGRFERGVEIDDDLAWNHHGVAWNLFASGQARAALRPGRLALECSRDAWERTYFTIALARYEIALGRSARAIELLNERLAESDVLRVDRGPLNAWLAQAEMALPDPARAQQGRLRGLAVLAVEALPAEDLVRLVGALAQPRVGVGAAWGGYRAGGTSEAARLELAGALAAREEPLAKRLRASLLFDLGRPALAEALLASIEDRAEGQPLDGAARLGPLDASSAPRARAARFARGEGRAAIADWVAWLPAFVKDDAGVPRDLALARLARSAEHGDDRELAAALIAAGWFAEAHAFAEDLASRDGAAALALESRAAAGLVLVDGVARVLDLVDRGERHGGALASASDLGAPEGGGEPTRWFTRKPDVVDSLDDLLGALSPLFTAFHRVPGADPRVIDLGVSPRSSYGPAATVVHPGPTFSAEDERVGLGAVGAPVAGLATELAEIGRFGIFGEAVGGGGPDGTLLRRVLVEVRSGEHLGVEWSGLVAWCDGADVQSRPGRRGARIAGAALHEGYWIDLAVVRDELAAWRALERRFLGPDAEPDAVDRALSVKGLGVEELGPLGAGSLVPLLGEADRVRVAVLRDRGPDAPITLAELAELTALHEEGHLTDRTRFLPLSRHVGAVLRFVLDAGMTPGGIARVLEERAQLVALCEAPDPRMALADVLAGAELGGSVTPHAEAYRALLERWLATLARSAEDPARFPALDRGRAFAHQLHRLSPEDVRAVSRELARRRGLLD